MNEGDFVRFGKWVGDGYSQFIGFYKWPAWGAQRINLTTSDGQGGYSFERNVKHASDAVEGEDYWVETDEDPTILDDKRALQGQTVYVSIAREGGDSRIFRGFVLSAPDKDAAKGERPLRICYFDTRRNRTRVRTLIPQHQAIPCDSFWAVDLPEPTFCPED